jgi:hypothetical protein
MVSFLTRSFAKLVDDQLAKGVMVESTPQVKLFCIPIVETDACECAIRYLH